MLRRRDLRVTHNPCHRTDHGDLDIVLRPDGIAGSYDELATRAQLMHAGPVTDYVAAVADIIRSKRAAARMTGEPKYTADADRLERLLTDDPTPQHRNDRGLESRERDSPGPTRRAGTAPEVATGRSVADFDTLAPSKFLNFLWCRLIPVRG